MMRGKAKKFCVCLDIKVEGRWKLVVLSVPFFQIRLELQLMFDIGNVDERYTELLQKFGRLELPGVSDEVTMWSIAVAVAH